METLIQSFTHSFAQLTSCGVDQSRYATHGGKLAQFTYSVLNYVSTTVFIPLCTSDRNKPFFFFFFFFFFIDFLFILGINKFIYVYFRPSIVVRNSIDFLFCAFVQGKKKKKKEKKEKYLDFPLVSIRKNNDQS